MSLSQFKFTHAQREQSFMRGRFDIFVRLSTITDATQIEERDLGERVIANYSPTFRFCVRLK